MDASVYIYDILDELCEENIKVGNLYIGGSYVDQHLSNLTQEKAAYTYYEYKKGDSYGELP